MDQVLRASLGSDVPAAIGSTPHDAVGPRQGARGTLQVVAHILWGPESSMGSWAP